MWVIKFKVSTKGQVISSLAVKHNVSIASYAISYYKDKKWLYLIAFGFAFGEEKCKKAFYKDIRRNPAVVKYEVKNDFTVGIIKQPLFTEPFWDTRIIRLSPLTINHKEKKNLWHLGSFDRNALLNIYKLAKKHFGAELLKFKQEKITNISMTRVLPELTKNQKRAFELAINHGYYEQPRKIHLEKLAEIMKISYSTYQEHLRKAEAKIIPNVYREL